MITVNENLKGLKSYSGLSCEKSGFKAEYKTKGKSGVQLSKFYQKPALDNTCTVIGGFSEIRSDFADEADQYLER